MDLLERGSVLEEIARIRASTTDGGRVVVISGEAGIGKTSLVEQFVAGASGPVFWGACESLFSPRPLGPLHDIALQSSPELLQLLQNGTSRPTIFGAFLELLQHDDAPAVVVVDDAQWADEATLDLLKFIGRRIRLTRCLLCLTYRDDEVGPDHPFRYVLGDLPHRFVTRIQLQPLSRSAVASLAERAGRPAAGIYEATGGNPFFVSEVLASDEGLPPTVRDAVMARVLRLPVDAQALLEAVSVIPTRAETWLVAEVAAPSAAALDVCTTAGLLRLDGNTLAFRHELSRLAVERSVPAPRRQSLHGRVLEVLEQHRTEAVDPARLVYHADQAGKSDAVLQHAPEAAVRAANLGAHRLAAAQYEIALRHASNRSDPERAALYEARAGECVLTGHVAEAREAGEAALQIWRALGNPSRTGTTLRTLARAHWHLGDNQRADACAREAVHVLETLPPGPELAMAYSNLSQQYMLRLATAEAIDWGGRALSLADKLGAVEVRMHALNNVGVALHCSNREGGFELLEESLRLAIQHDRQEHVARAYANLLDIAMSTRDVELAERYFDDAITYSVDRDLHSVALCLFGERALHRLRRGQWELAADDAQRALNHPVVPPVDRVAPLVVLGLLRTRRGDSGAAAALDEAREIARPTGELQRVIPVAAARAEAAWTRGSLEDAMDELQEALELARLRANPWAVGEIASWLWRAGVLEHPPTDVTWPYYLQMVGEWESAAEAWVQIGFPFEQAMTLGDGDAEGQRHGLELLDRLGAIATAARLRQTLRAGGARHLPRGPRAATRKNPAGLTSRQMDVIGLLAEGLTNGDIAARLFVSPRTVEHHVAAILTKLGAQSRTEAAELARRSGWITPSG